MSVRLTVLGKSPSWQDSDGACSGYLVELRDRMLLLDCGSGVFAKLRSHGAYERVESILISHFHADHMLDLVPFAFALTYGPPVRSDRPLLHVPPGAQEKFRHVCGAWGSETLIEDAFELIEYDPDSELEVAGARVRFQPLPHYTPSYAIELRASGEVRRLIYSADCGPNELLAGFARDAELLLIESTLVDPEPPTDEPPGHLAAGQAGAIAREAMVGRLVLTHFSDQLDPDALRARAEEAFGSEIELAAEGAVYEL